MTMDDLKQRVVDGCLPKWITEKTITDMKDDNNRKRFCRNIAILDILSAEYSSNFARIQDLAMMYPSDDPRRIMFQRVTPFVADSVVYSLLKMANRLGSGYVLATNTCDQNVTAVHHVSASVSHAMLEFVRQLFRPIQFDNIDSAIVDGKSALDEKQPSEQPECTTFETPVTGPTPYQEERPPMIDLRPCFNTDDGCKEFYNV